MDTVLYRQGFRYSEKEFRTEADFEKLVVDNSKTLFGQHSVYVDAKKKLANATFGGVIPDGFLFDLTDKNAPEFYIVEVELSKHSFFNHIFPQTTKFFAFFKNPDSQGKLVDKLYEIFSTDDELRQQLKSRIGNREIFKFPLICFSSEPIRILFTLKNNVSESRPLEGVLYRIPVKSE